MSEIVDNVEVWSGKNRAGENFPVGVLISRRLRPHVHAFYTFARNADDIADSPLLSAEEKLSRLDAMAQALEGVQPRRSPAAARLRTSLAETALTDVHCHELLDAFRQDAVQARYSDWGELLGYCRLSAMPVGRHVLDLHGEDRATWPASDALCASLQVLNHLQDCAADLATLDRCYLPTDMLRDAGAKMAMLREPRTAPQLRRVLDTLLDRCDALNAQAVALPRQVRDRRLRLEVAVIAGLARRLARRLREGDPIATRIKLTRADAAVTLFAALRVLS